jgi:hypothetical protein
MDKRESPSVVITALAISCAIPIVFGLALVLIETLLG